MKLRLHIIGKQFFLIFLSLIAANASIAQPARTTLTEKINNNAAVKQFYGPAHGKLFWFYNNADALALRQSLVTLVDTCNRYGLIAENYHLNFLQHHMLPSKADSTKLPLIDEVFTDAAIGISRDIYAGDITGFLSYDELSAKCAEKDMATILKGLSNVDNGSALQVFVSSLEPKNGQYTAIKKNLAFAIKLNAVEGIKRLTSEINYVRWINHLNLKTFILVNIPSGTLDFYRNDSAILTMKVVVGKPSTRTPRFAANCTEVVLYPYWNVPIKIGLSELLPQFKKSPALVDGMNMQVIDVNGRVINHHNLDWSAYNSTNFPYQFRQSTGCDNALGVIKFNLTDPYSVYMHDTNNKLAFLLANRYLSHGCIRLEKPVELANYILPQKLDSSFIASCLKDQKPTVLQIPNPVPVLVVYLITNPDFNYQPVFYKDVYRLFK